MKLKEIGKNILKTVEITNISENGIWIIIKEKEYKNQLRFSLTQFFNNTLFFGFEEHLKNNHFHCILY